MRAGAIIDVAVQNLLVDAVTGAQGRRGSAIGSHDSGSRPEGEEDEDEDEGNWE